MRFGVLGPIRVVICDAVVPVSGRARTALLAVLLSRPDEDVSTEWLCDTLWNDQQDRSIHRLHTTVHRLRQSLDEPDRVVSLPGSYRLRVGPGELDAEEFDSALERALATSDPLARLEQLRSALDLWRGSPFQGVDVPALAAPADRLTERLHAAREEFFAAHLACGRPTEIIGQLQEQVRLHPLRERLHALLMEALDAGGRRADALSAFRSARETIVDELGLEPGPMLRQAELRILGDDEAVTALPPAPLPPAQVPAPPSGFVGRRDELAELDSLLQPTGPAAIVVVSGTAGVGKTALVTHWVHEHRERYPDGQLYVDLQGFSPQDPLPAETALRGFLGALGAEPSAVPPGLADRAAMLRTWSYDRRLLIVLDNAASAEQVRPLLPNGSSCAVLVTSRHSLDGLGVREGASALQLGPMPPDDATALLARRGGEAARDPRLLALLAEHCARLPVALRVAAERIRECPPDELGELVAALEHGGLDVLDTGDDDTSVRSVLSWSYQQLSPDAAQLFRLCGFRCPHPQHRIDAAWATDLLGRTDRHGGARLLRELQRARLIERVRSGTFTMHKVLQAYAAELAEGVDDEHVAQLRMFQHHLDGAAVAAAPVHPPEAARRSDPAPGAVAIPRLDCAAGLRWLDERLGSLTCTAEFASDDYVVDLALLLGPYFELTDHVDEALRVHGRARGAAHRQGDTIAEGVACRGLGVAELRRRRPDRAVDLLRNSLDLAETGDDAETASAAAAHLARAHAIADRPAEAMAAAREAVAHLAGCEPDASPLTLVTLGDVHGLCGEYDAAHDLLDAGRVRAGERRLPAVELIALRRLARLRRRLGRAAPATELDRRADDLVARHHLDGLLAGTTQLTGTTHVDPGSAVPDVPVS